VADEAVTLGRLPRLPQLDGLRAVAILLLVGLHLGFTLSMPLRTREILAPILGNAPVTLFFVLSGYLITTLLVREQQLTGSIRLRTFAARRALRIFPAYLVYMGLAAILIAVGKLDSSWRHWFLATVYLWDYVPATVRWFGHTWSLAVEEQFYLVWPATLLLLRTRWAVRLALAIVVLEPFIRWFTWHNWPQDQARFNFMAHENLDAVLAGAALAMLPVALPGGYRAFTKVAVRLRLELVGLALYLFAAPYLIYADSRLYDRYLAGSLFAISGALAVHGLVERPHGLAARALASPAMRHLGALSYSLYLWQQPWLDVDYSINPFVRVLGAVATAEASLWLIEKPFLRLKSRLRSPGAERDGLEPGRAATPAAADLPAAAG
jgi:peptidoglycan/LPS O-acetylase OafA/YrhL